MSLTADNLLNSIHIILNELKKDIFMRFNYNLDENITYLDLTRNLILLENVFSEQYLLRQRIQSQQTVAHPSSLLPKQTLQRPSNLQNQDYLSYGIDLPSPHFLFPNNSQIESSKDSFPLFHKKSVQEQQNSLEYIQKQNKTMRTDVRDNSLKEQNTIIETRYIQHHPKDQLNQQIENKRNQIDYRESRGKMDNENKDNNMDQFENKIKNRNKDKLKYNNNRNRDENNYNSQKHNQRLKKFQLAAIELEELQKIREKELQKVKQIERAIKIREEETIPKKNSNQNIDDLRIFKSQKKAREKKYIQNISEQIYKLDEEISGITSYIQQCILQDN